MINSAAVSKPLSVAAGFKYGVEVAFVSDKKNSLSGFFNKMPPTGQPVAYAEFSDDNCLIEPFGILSRGCF